MNNPIIQEDLRTITGSGLKWELFEGKTVLITGAGGFLPSYMVETLLYLNDHVLKNKALLICLVRNRRKAEARFAGSLSRNDFILLVQDVCEKIELDFKVDYIIHAASQASPKYYGKDPVGTLLPNVLATANLLDLAKTDKAAGFLFFSSGEVYGEMGDKIPTKETDFGFVDPAEVRSCYAESKRMGENMCVSWHRQYGVPAKIIRPFHTYGPGMDLEDGRVFADFVSDIVHGRNIVMKSDGSARRSFCYLADATTGFFTVLLKGKNGQAYNVGNDKGEISILGLAELLIGLFPEKALTVTKMGEIRQEGYLMSRIVRNCPEISKVRSLGWEPRVSLEEGFKRTVRSFLCD